MPCVVDLRGTIEESDGSVQPGFNATAIRTVTETATAPITATTAYLLGRSSLHR